MKNRKTNKVMMAEAEEERGKEGGI